MKMEATRMDAYKLMHNGILALADVEQNGIKIDVPYCKAQIENIDRRVAKIKSRIACTELGKKWRRAYPHNMNLNSDHQLRHVLYNVLGYEAVQLTDNGNPKVDENALLGTGNKGAKIYA